MLAAARRTTACLLAAGLAASGCTPAVDARANVSGDTIVLLSARAFDGSDRAARLLEDMVSASDVLGPARFVVIEAPGGEFTSLVEALDGLHDVRAVVALLGDLSVVDGNDPSVRDRGTERLRGRRISLDLIAETLRSLRACARRSGARLVPATAPLGMQGRIEVPELLAVADELRARHGAVDVGARFEELDPALLFSNGIDRLDAYGHDELARALYTALSEDPGPIPPRDAAERAARSEARALQAFARGDFEGFAEEAATALAGTAPTPRHAMRRAAIAAALRGPDAGVDQLAGHVQHAAAVPGLALWHALRDEPHEAAPADDPFESALAETLRAITRAEASAPALARGLVDTAPHRLEAWILDQLARSRNPVPTDVRAEARRNLSHFPRTAVDDRLTSRLFEAWPAALISLPAVYLASLPFDVLQPTGPILEAARRRARFGYTTEAFHLMKQEMGDDRFPPSWIEAREGWALR